MKKFLLLSIAFFAVILFACQKSNFNYPETKKVDTVDNYFGTKVEDPYRWLENDTASEVENWVEAQNKVTFNYLEQIPYRSKIKDRLTKIWNYKKIGTPKQSGDKYFFFMNDGLQDQSVLYMAENLDAEPQVVLDPNTFSEDGSVALAGYEISNNGKYLAYSISRGGSDWREIYIKDLKTMEKLEDEVKWVKFSGIAWYKDGFFYSRYDEPKEGEELSQMNKGHKVYYHKLGDDQSKDELIFKNPKYPKRNYSPDVSKDEKYLYVYESRGTHGNNVFIKNLQTGKNFVKLTTGFKYEYRILGHRGDKLIVHTNYNAPKYKVVKIDVHKRDVGNWIEVIPEQKNVLRQCQLAGDNIIASYLKDAHSEVKVFSNEGDLLYDLELPGLGSVGSMTGNQKSNELYYSFASYTTPTQIWKHNMETKKSEIVFKPEIDINTDEYVTEQVFYESKDGTQIPMFLVHKKGIEKDGNNPTLLYGYGGFNVSLTPRFSVSNMIWLENGGIYAVANLRGGGEYGERWHRQGMRLNKKNVFNDFIAAAEYLIENNYTNNDKIAINGGSNGGLLVGAVTNKRPELFEVAIPEVGVMDMLRFHKFTIGWAWVDEYGSSEDSLDFENLYSYSPLHNINGERDYPAVLVMTADHDDRVVPAHSFKYIATLQEKYKGENPTMIRIQTKAGHGAGKATSVAIQEEADVWSFIFHNMEIQPKY
jgi:prolyl oligopeptidase